LKTEGGPKRLIAAAFIFFWSRSVSRTLSYISR
jgi:hypothetical protein